MVLAAGTLVAARYLGGFGGAAVAGVGLGLGALALGRRRPNALRGRDRGDEEPKPW